MHAIACVECGVAVTHGTHVCPQCGCPDPAVAPSTRPLTPVEANMIEQIATYQQVSAILWLVFGILQVISVVAIIAGAWNIYAALTRFKLPALIRARAPGIPAAFEDITQLVIIAVINLLVGGAIGLLFVAFDFYVRHLVLQHRLVFEKSGTHPNQGEFTA
jgi:hypothetical protein